MLTMQYAITGYTACTRDPSTLTKLIAHLSIKTVQRDVSVTTASDISRVSPQYLGVHSLQVLWHQGLVSQVAVIQPEPAWECVSGGHVEVLVQALLVERFFLRLHTRPSCLTTASPAVCGNLQPSSRLAATSCPKASPAKRTGTASQMLLTNIMGRILSL